jgi:CheY-like chemotaxis protein
MKALRILLVEDNPLLRSIIESQLMYLGVATRSVGDGSEAITALQQEDFDLVLMDVQMPIVNGLDATRRIRNWEKERSRHTTIIALTAHAMRGDKEACFDAGMDDYIAKPIRLEKLEEVLNLHCNHHNNFAE